MVTILKVVLIESHGADTAPEYSPHLYRSLLLSTVSRRDLPGAFVPQTRD
jgi:hypothetical protein